MKSLDDQYYLYYEAGCISYIKDDFYFMPTSSVCFSLIKDNKPLISYSAKTNYDLCELNFQDNYSTINKIINNIEQKRNIKLFNRDKDGKIIKQYQNMINPMFIRRFILILLEMLQKQDINIKIITDSHFSRIWLTNSRLITSHQIVKKNNTFNGKVYILNKEIKTYERDFAAVANNLCTIDHINYYDNIVYKLIKYISGENRIQYMENIEDLILIESITRYMESCKIIQ